MKLLEGKKSSLVFLKAKMSSSSKLKGQSANRYIRGSSPPPSGFPEFSRAISPRKAKYNQFISGFNWRFHPKMWGFQL
jgi:hypothetical protein